MRDPNRTEPLSGSWHSYGQQCNKWWDTQARCIRGSSAHSAEGLPRTHQREGFSVGRTHGLLTPKFLGLRICRNGGGLAP
jgi:hypothetical protein